jgi:hypothetical protein
LIAIGIEAAVVVMLFIAVAIMMAMVTVFAPLGHRHPTAVTITPAVMLPTAVLHATAATFALTTTHREVMSMRTVPRVDALVWSVRVVAEAHDDDTPLVLVACEAAVLETLMPHGVHVVRSGRHRVMAMMAVAVGTTAIAIACGGRGRECDAAGERERRDKNCAAKIAHEILLSDQPMRAFCDGRKLASLLCDYPFFTGRRRLDTSGWSPSRAVRALEAENVAVSCRWRL